jgi:hypothetical protein
MFDLQIDKKKKQKTKNYLQWIKVVKKKKTAHGQNILHEISYCPSIYYLKTKINPKQ